MDPEQQSSALLAPTQEHLAQIKVFPLIPALRKDITNTIDTALSWEQLTASDINFTIVRPLVLKYARLKNMSCVYAALVVRSYFLAESEVELAYAGVMLSRASLAQILAIKLLSRWAANHIQLVAVLTTCWNPLAGATDEVVDEVKQTLGAHANEDIDSPQSAIEMAISTQSKFFLSSPVTQRVINDIYTGRIVFSTTAHRSILADNYKPRAIEIYNPQNAPFLDHYRLRVPKYGAVLEFVNFALLLFTFVLCLANQNESKLTPWELAFIVFASAFTLEEYTASTEHGWIIYIANMWNAFDFAFILIFLTYLALRIKGLSDGNLDLSDMAFDILSCGACILFPRLAFFAVSNNVVILSLRAMITQFVFFIGIAAICFSGLLFTLWTLARDAPNDHAWTFKSIAWLMVQIWFGNTYLSFAQATSFHPLFGPILMTVFAALSNTLLLTILISILSNTVARIDANATQEYLFQFAITTIEGVKSDALFSYQPPFNLLAFLILKPASWFLTPRALHSTNVFLIRLTSLPQLVLIGLYERHLAAGQGLRETSKDAAQSFFNSLPRHIKNMPLVEALVGSSSNDLYDAIFDVDIGEEDDIFDDDEFGDEIPALRSFHSRENVNARSDGSPAPRIRRRPASLSRAATVTSERTSPRPRLLSSLTPIDPVHSGEMLSSARSPLARLFNPRFPSTNEPPHTAIAENVKKIEALLEDVKELPVQRLKEEMKELQDRQARIENLLLMLTRGMRNETSRHDSIP
ncbi:receptor-activated Ca2+-permeable cation channel [Crucibulum laeve]|uniref:Receptor-activated Ca2+-permeable cation channel n=1 Tax=Crucibulum laeve TaxID=68775 RepID=A0A5C3MFS8_9AGAR|nr:receptor-activated Ca2+-permeable cation channel [Crucibulum laeve]